MTTPALIGRDHALAALREALAQARARRGQLVLVSGEPGIGKSALADLIGREAEAGGASVVFGRAWELAEAPPYFPVWSGLRALGIEPPAGPSVEADAFHLWERVLQALGQAAAARPVVWILEDLHAADHLTLDLLTFLARPLRALSVLLLVTLRDRDPRIGDRTATRLARLARDGQELRLGQLDREQTGALAAAIAGRPLPAAAARQLFELTGGNPLFVIECARAHRGGVPAALPATVRELTRERISILPAPAREALECAAVVGRDFSAAVIAHMLGGLPAQVIERLAPALKAGVILELRPGQYRFSHILVRDAIEEGLTAAARAGLHLRAGAALTGDSVEARVERARHALAALSPEGVALAREAARALVAMGSPDRALSLYQRIEDAHAAGLAEAQATAEEALERAAVARAAGRHREATQRCEAVLAEARARADGRLLALAALERGAELRPATVDLELVAALREALAAPGLVDPALRCRTEARLAGALQPADDPRVPMAMARAAIETARALGDPAVLLEVLHTAGAALVDFAPLDERLALGTELLALALARGDGARALVAQNRLALDHAEAGDFAAFDGDVDRMRSLSVELGHPRRRWRGLLLESMRAVARGDFELSDRCLVEIQEQASLTDDPALAMSLSAHAANRAILFHRDEEVRQHLTVLDQAMENVPQADLVKAAIRSASLAHLEDRAGAASALARIRGRHLMLFEQMIYLAIDVYPLVGDRHEQEALYALLLPNAERHLISGHVPVTYEGPVLRGLAVLDAALGRTDPAVARLREAIAGARGRGHRLWVAQLSYDLGRVLVEAGRAGEAAAPLDEAIALADALGMPGLALRARARRQSGAIVVAPPAPVATAPALVMVREADVWRIESGSRVVRVRHNRGLELLARLVERPGEEVHVLALSSDAGGALVEGDAGEALDAQARREYQERLQELEGELDEAEQANDLGRAARLGRERDALQAELSRALGLRGRARPAASASERARVNIQRRLKDAVTRIGEADPDLGARLSAAVHTGTYCCFRP